MIRIISWDDTYRGAWRDLGLSWLQQYELVEEEDLRILQDPEGSILALGGQIFLAVEDGVLLGTLSLIPEGEGVYELAKLGVDPAHRRRGIADRLMDQVHQWVHAQGANKLILFTNRKLKAAQKLYDKWCFTEIYAPDEKFLLSDKQMEKQLHAPAYAVMKTPLGFMRLEEEAGALIRITLPVQEENPVPAETPLLQRTCLQMEEYFAGQRQRLEVPFRITGRSPFQCNVLETLRRQVPFGSTISYGLLAELAGYPRAARAVGTAMNKNPLCILIPCHRVLPADGSLGSYGAADGAKSKAWLLALEGVYPPN